MRRLLIALVFAAGFGSGFPAMGIPADEVPQLIFQLLRGPGPQADRAIERLRYIGPRDAGPPLRALLASDDTRTRVAITSALVVVRDPDAAPQLIRCLQDRDWEVRRNAVQALAAVRSRSAIHPLETTLLMDESDRVRKVTVQALAGLNAGGRALATVAKRDGSIEIRLAALDALTHTLDPSVGFILRPLLSDASGMVRFAAARALAWQGDAAAKELLTKTATGPDPELARRAITAVSDVPKVWAVDLLVRELDATDFETALLSAAGLARRGDTRGPRYLIKAAASGGERGEQAEKMMNKLSISPVDPKWRE